MVILFNAKETSFSEKHRAGEQVRAKVSEAGR